jgi:hypothetical protein
MKRVGELSQPSKIRPNPLLISVDKAPKYNHQKRQMQRPTYQGRYRDNKALALVQS